MSSLRTQSEGGLPRSYTRACLLLLLAEGPSHGYDLLEQVREVGVRGADAGGLYRTLRAMEQEELVASWWEPSQSGPARRTYTLTAAGRRALDESVGALTDVEDLLRGLLARYHALAVGANANARP